MPMGIRHYIHFFFPSKDLNIPLLLDELFLPTKEGFSKEYLLNLKYLDFYELGFQSSKGNIPSSYSFGGSIKVQFFNKGKLISEHFVSTIQRMTAHGRDINHIDEFTLLDVRLDERYKGDLKIRLTVLKPDLQLSQYSDSLNLYLKVSAYPAP